jgi:hypothetical protein
LEEAVDLSSDRLLLIIIFFLNNYKVIFRIKSLYVSVTLYAVWLSVARKHYEGGDI